MPIDEEVPPGWICPQCKCETVFIMATCVVRVDSNGAWPSDESGFEWEDDSPAHCEECKWRGSANDAATAAQAKYPQLG